MTRVAVVSLATDAAGGTRDTGLAAALHLAGLGLDIALLDADPPTAAEAAEQISAGGQRCAAVAADLADSASVNAALNHVRSELGSPSVLLNCVPLGSPEPLAAEERYAEARRSLRALFVCCRAVCTHMVRGRWGRIVNIAHPVGADEAGDREWRDGQTVLGGLVGFTRSAALELAGYGITANYIAPTGCYPAGPAPAPAPPLAAAASRDASSYSAGVASLTGFLISDQASAITGQGGYLAGRPAVPSASGE
ncbi:MAG: SDR family oxidoreductase [Catenulispora sp.]|nr:SDR family oxidoreductase [Catenulispora sp.]